MHRKSPARRKASKWVDRAAKSMTSPRVVTALGNRLYARRHGERPPATPGPLEAIDPSKVKRILVVRLDEIGDSVLSVPFLRSLRRHFAEARITLVVKSPVANLLEPCPYFDELLVYDVYTSARWWEPLVRHARAFSFARRHLWKSRYDLAIMPRWGSDFYHSSLVMYLSGARDRLGFSPQAAGEKLALNDNLERFYTATLAASGVKHEVERNLDIVSALGGDATDTELEAWTTSPDEQWAADKLSRLGSDPAEDLLVAIAPGAGLARRIWPLERWSEIAHWLRNDLGAKVVVVGGPSDAASATDLERSAESGIESVAGTATLRQTQALLRSCNLLVANDAGPVHLAASVGVPVVCVSCHPLDGDVSHPNSPERFRPFGVPAAVVQPATAAAAGCSAGCKELMPHCILGVSESEVREAVAALLDNGLARGSGASAYVG